MILAIVFKYYSTSINSDQDHRDARTAPDPLPDDAGVREELEALRDAYIDRLHRRSNDFEATRELRLVNAKLQRTSRGVQVVTTSS